MVSAEEFDCIVNARWRIWHAGKWCPVVRLFAGQRVVSNPLHASSVCAYTGEESGAWLAIEVSPFDVLARESGCAPDWMPWHEVARIREAAGRAPLARETLN